jgi:hypothetical protein
MQRSLSLPLDLNCDVAANSNAGCAVKMSDESSFGPAFNAVGGGWLVDILVQGELQVTTIKNRYAMERTNSTIKVWFWPRNSTYVPGDVQNDTGNVDTDAWVRLFQGIHAVSSSVITTFVRFNFSGHSGCVLPFRSVRLCLALWCPQHYHQPFLL